MAQFVTRTDDELAAAVDELIAQGLVDSRSAAVRKGLRMLIDQTRRAETAASIVGGYRVHPQTAEEVGWADEATIRMITEESW